MPKYALTEKQEARLQNDFRYHPPMDDQIGRYQGIRTAFGSIARYIMENTPESREQSVALTHLDIAMTQANAAIARNEKPE